MSSLQLTIIGALVVVVFVVYLSLPIRRAIVLGRVLVDESKAYTQTPVNSTMKFLVIGDSTAVGSGGSYGESVAGYLGRDFPQATVVNDSRNGMKIDEFLTRLQARKDEHYDLIVFQIGGNDIVRLTPTTDIENRLEQALTLTDTMASTTIVICSGNVGLAPTFKWPLSLLYEVRSKDVFKRYAQTTRKHPQSHYIDLYKNREDDIFLTDISKYYAPDYFHPSGAGYAVWYDEVRKELVRLEILTS